MHVQLGLLTLIAALAANAAAAPPAHYHAQGEMAGEVTATTVLLQSRLTAIPGPDLDADGDIAGAAGDNSAPTYRTHRVQRHLQLCFNEGRDYRSPNTQVDGQANRVAIAKPAGYDEADYEMLFRAIAVGQSDGFFKTSPVPNRKTDSNNTVGTARGSSPSS